MLAEDAHLYFDLPANSPYMLIVAPVAKSRQNPLPADYGTRDLWQKLYFERSDLPSITHVDFSARVQTVHQETNPLYWQLLQSMKKLTGHGILINTSFNVRGEPIVCTPQDAYLCFMRTEMDALVIGEFLFLKEEQPKLAEETNWREQYQLD